MTTVFIVLATFLLAFSALFWSSKGWLNVAVKVALLGATVLGAICSAGALGVA